MIFYVTTDAENAEGLPTKGFNFEVPGVHSLEAFSEMMVSQGFVIGNMLLMQGTNVNRIAMTVFKRNAITAKLSKLN